MYLTRRPVAAHHKRDFDAVLVLVLAADQHLCAFCLDLQRIKSTVDRAFRLRLVKCKPCDVSEAFVSGFRQCPGRWR